LELKRKGRSKGFTGFTQSLRHRGRRQGRRREEWKIRFEERANGRSVNKFMKYNQLNM